MKMRQQPCCPHMVRCCYGILGSLVVICLIGGLICVILGVKEMDKHSEQSTILFVFGGLLSAVGVVVAFHIMVFFLMTRNKAGRDKTPTGAESDKQALTESSEDLHPSDEKCVICQEGLKMTIANPCGHAFHDECIEKCRLEKQSCPICRLPCGDTLTYTVNETAAVHKGPTVLK